MAAAHKCEGCFQQTTAERVTCDECFAEGRAAQVEVARQGGNMAEQLAAFQFAVAQRAQRLRAQRATVPQATPQSSSMFNPVPAGRA